MISLQHCTKRFPITGGSVLALDDVSLEVEEGVIQGIVGSSGAGKSTLLRLVNLLERPDHGEVVVAGANLCGLSRRKLNVARRQIGMVFQQFNLLESATIFDNIALPLRLAGVPEQRVRERVTTLLGFVELEDKAHTVPARLSGGQKQRVGIARALASSPRVLLADEATSALDPDTTESILRLLRRVNEELGVTIMLITHEMGVIAQVCHRVGVMSRGRIVEEGPVLDVFASPQEPITRRFVRTIIDDRVPERLVDALATTGEDQELWRITAVGEATAEPLLSDLALRHGVRSRVLTASVSEIDAVPLSVFVVQVDGDPHTLRKARLGVPPSGPRIDLLQASDLRTANHEGAAA